MLRRCLPVLFDNVMVVGGGTMGSGIAQVSAAHGKRVVLVDRSEDILEKSISSMSRSLEKVAARKFKESTDPAAEAEDWVGAVLARVTTSTNAAEAAAAGPDLVIEAIAENINIKNNLWQEVDAQAPAATVFASNTSSLSIANMASATKRAELFGGLHFFSPVPMMQLVEVVQAKATSAETMHRLVEFSKEIGKTPIKCKDTKGFVVNRLLVPYLMEAIRMVERGDASIEDIDTAMRLGAGHPMGPLKLSDAVGNDITQAIIKGWNQDEPDNQLFTPSPLLNDMVAEGRLGLKANSGGFYPK